jgi:hydrogenase maturation factor HypF (carbamoyltransferase family)
VKAIEQFCEITPVERALLESKEHPIVLLKKRGSLAAPQHISEYVAPGQSTLGVMLPYTPLHELLFHPAHIRLSTEKSVGRQASSLIPHPLVMTSGISRRTLPLATTAH